MKARIVLMTLAFLIFSLAGICQSSTESTVRVITRDGNEYFGKIIQKDSVSLRLMTEKLGEISIRIEDVRSVTPIDSGKKVKGQYWDGNPQSARYFFAPSGYGLKKGEGYYQNVWIVFNQASYGITDHLTIGAGLVPLFIFAGEATPAWLSVKGSFPVVKDKVNIGAGTIVGTVIGDGGMFGIAYGIGTFGSADRNISIGAGWAYSDGGVADRPTLTLSGMTRIGRRWYLLSENYFLNFGDGEAYGLVSGGARYVSKSIGVDFGLFMPIGAGTWVAVPWLGLTVPFGKRRAVK